MTNKDWKEQFKQEFGIHFSNSEFSFAISFIESLLKSKQEEIEEAMDRMKKVHKFKVTEVEDIAKESYNQALDDLKPIISNLLK